MKKWLKERFGEPTSFLALAGTLQFVGLMTKDDNIPVIAESVAQNADQLANGDYIGAAMNIGTMIALGLGFLKREKGGR